MNDTATLRVEITEAMLGGQPGQAPPAAPPPVEPPKHVMMGGTKVPFGSLDPASQQLIMQALGRQAPDSPAAHLQAQMNLMEQQTAAAKSSETLLQKLVTETEKTKQRRDRPSARGGAPGSLVPDDLLTRALPFKVDSLERPDDTAEYFAGRRAEFRLWDTDPPHVRRPQDAPQRPRVDDEGGGVGLWQQMALNRLMGGQANIGRTVMQQMSERFFVKDETGALKGLTTLGKAGAVAGVARAAAATAATVYKRATEFAIQDIYARTAVTGARLRGDIEGESRAVAARPSAWEMVPLVGEFARLNREYRQARTEENLQRRQALLDLGSRGRAFSGDLVQSGVQSQLLQLAYRQQVGQQAGKDLAQVEQARAEREYVERLMVLGGRGPQGTLQLARKETLEQRRITEVLAAAQLAGGTAVDRAREAARKADQGDQSEIAKLHRELQRNTEKMEQVRKMLQDIRDNATKAGRAQEVVKAFEFAGRVRHEVPLDPVMDNAGNQPPIRPAFNVF